MFIGHFDDIINKEFFILFDVVSVVQKTRILWHNDDIFV